MSTDANVRGDLRRRRGSSREWEGWAVEWRATGCVRLFTTKRAARAYLALPLYDSETGARKEPDAELFPVSLRFAP